jgi:hypothetical protein
MIANISPGSQLNLRPGADCICTHLCDEYRALMHHLQTRECVR